MLREKRQWFEVLFVVADLIVVSFAWMLAYWVRFQTQWIPATKGIPEVSDYIELLPVICIIWGGIFRWLGLYRSARGSRPTRELYLLLNGNALGVVLLIVFIFLLREKDIEYSRLVFAYFGAFSTLFTMGQRIFLRAFLREVRRRGYNLRYLLIVGDGQVASDLAQRIRLHREIGLQLVGCLSKEEQEQGPGGLPFVGRYSDLKHILHQMDIDQVVVALPLEDSQWLPDIMEQIGDTLVDVRIVPDLYRFVSLCGSIEEFEGLPVISLRESPMGGVNLCFKRIFDLFFAAIALVVFSIPMLLVALIVKLSSKGPIFYRQERVSFDGTSFSILKFRTMKIDAEEQGPGWTKPGDARVTVTGRILRATSLDELPQIFNVLAGDMSLVGPRPERPVYIDEFRSRIPGYMLRHRVPAGVTGWAQVNGWRGDTSIDKRIEYDLFYIEHWSLFFDLKILFMTIYRGFIAGNAY